MKRRLSAFVLALAMLLTLPGCSSGKAGDLMAGITPNSATPSEPIVSADPVDFGVRLFQHSAKEGENTLISPLSVLSALAMTANGAKGDTLAQMEDVLGMPVGELNQYLRTFMADLPDEETCKLHVANSVWFRDDPSFTVEQPFLQTNADYYGAGVYKAPFDDSTKRDINNWVKEHNDGMKEIPAFRFKECILVNKEQNIIRNENEQTRYNTKYENHMHYCLKYH